jgi:hypothetical protein
MSDAPLDPNRKTLMEEATAGDSGKSASLLRSATPEEEEAENERMVEEFTKSLPAIFVDTYYLSLTKTVARITLGEYTDDGRVFYRGAYVMPTQSAVELAKAILELFGKTEKDVPGG